MQFLGRCCSFWLHEKKGAMSVKIEYLKEFISLSETLNYSAAAERLYISQSTLSRHVSMLEEEIGARLLLRTTHGVELTEIGRESVKTFRDMLKRYEAFAEFAQNRQDQASGKLVLGLLYYSISDYFSDFIPLFRTQFPRITLDCQSYQPHELYEALMAGKLDIGQISVGGYPRAEEVRFHRFLKHKMIAIMREDHPLADRESIWLRELIGETCIELKEDYCSRICTHGLLEKCGMAFDKIIEAEHIETVPFVIKETGGFHLTGDSCRKQNVPGLRYIPIADEAFEADMAFTYCLNNPNPLIPLFLREADRFFRSTGPASIGKTE